MARIWGVAMGRGHVQVVLFRLLVTKLQATGGGSVAFLACPHSQPCGFSRRPLSSLGWEERRCPSRLCGTSPAMDTDSTDPCFEASPDAKAPLLAGSSRKTVTVLQRGRDYVVVAKPPSVVCHHSGWTGSRAKAKRGEEPEVPMLQRVRNAFGRRVNLIHRLDRGASGALLLAFADDEPDSLDAPDAAAKRRSATALLCEALASPLSTKTYVALVRGEGVLHGTDLKDKGWFAVDRPIKDEKGILHEATTYFRFLAGQSEGNVDQPRASLVLARPLTGRWHQVRRHLNGLSHPILGDSTHGSSTANREWKEKRNMPGERTCLHLARLTVTLNENATVGNVHLPRQIDVSCPLPEDMLSMMERYMPQVLANATPALDDEGIILQANPDVDMFETLNYEDDDATNEKTEDLNDDDVQILDEGSYHVVVDKPPAVVCHYSSWTRTSSNRFRDEPRPVLQRVRQKTGRLVNLVHRLDRSASGCLLLAFVPSREQTDERSNATAVLAKALQSDAARKTYVAVVSGDGTLQGQNLHQRGWFTVSTCVKDENGGIVSGAVTDVKFVASAPVPSVTNKTDGTAASRQSLSIVLARPSTGRWHQIRQHLASLSHPILGDSTHGFSRTNREWKEERGLREERTCLHLARLVLPPTIYTPHGINVVAPLPNDMVNVITTNVPELWERSKDMLQEEAIGAA